MVEPIKPSDILKAKLDKMPREALESFNELIAENFIDGKAEVKQKDIVARIVEKLGCSRNDIFSKGWLNIERLYESYGWEVKYDKPAYYENYDPYFIFEAKKPIA